MYSRGRNRGRGNNGRGRGRGNGTRMVPCRFFQQSGVCRFGSACDFSHAVTPGRGGEWPSTQRSPRVAETPEHEQAKIEYNDWKRAIKWPTDSQNERKAEQLWKDALAILDGSEREWKQMLPRDLDNDDYHGRMHMKSLLSMRMRAGDCDAFIRIARPFLLVITHADILSCLSVDNFVGGLYSFISGANGTRAIPFLQHLCEAIAILRTKGESAATTETFETTLLAMSTALRELLRREPRARLNDELPSLVETMEQFVDGRSLSRVLTMVHRRLGEVRAVMACAKAEEWAYHSS